MYYVGKLYYHLLPSLMFRLLICRELQHKRAGCVNSFYLFILSCVAYKISDHFWSGYCPMNTFDFHWQTKLNEALYGPVESLLDGASDDTWPAIRKLLRRETEVAVAGFSSALSGFEMDEATESKMLSNLEDHARGIVEAKAKEEAGRVLIRMKDRSLLCFLLISWPTMQTF